MIVKLNTKLDYIILLNYKHLREVQLQNSISFIVKDRLRSLSHLYLVEKLHIIIIIEITIIVIFFCKRLIQYTHDNPKQQTF